MMPPLLAIPDVSEGRDKDAIDAIAQAFAREARLLDVHSDPDHNRSVFTLAGAAGQLGHAVLVGAAETVRRLDPGHHEGLHRRVGAIDVAPVVYLDPADRGAAAAEALMLADLLGEELELPVFMYGELAAGRTRAELRRGVAAELAERIGRNPLEPDFGPPRPHPTAGAVLVTACPPLIAFNVELAPPATLADAKRIAADIREGGPHGLRSVSALGLWLAHRNVGQVSTNVEDHRATSLQDVVEAIGRSAKPARAELVGLAPRAAFDGFPDDVPVANRRLIEEALASHKRPAPNR